MNDAIEALRAARFNDIWSADADHLKTQEDVNATAGAGFVFFTIDPSDHVDPAADDYSVEELENRYAAVRDDAKWVDEYFGKTIKVDSKLKIEFDRATVLRAAVKYGRAIAHAIKLSEHNKIIFPAMRQKEFVRNISAKHFDTLFLRHRKVCA